MILRKILIFALLPHILPSASETCPYWKDIALSQGFKEYVVQLTKLTVLHVGLPAEFSERDTRLFADFLKRTPISTTIFKQNDNFRHEQRFTNVSTEFHAVLLVLCRNTVWLDVASGSTSPYYLHMYVFCAEYSQHSIFAHHLVKYKGHKVAPIRGSGVFNVTVRNQKVLVTDDGTVTCLNCTPNLLKEVELKILRNTLLPGNVITVICEHPYFCKFPSMKVLEEIVVDKNASFNQVPFEHVSQLHDVVQKTHDDPKTLFYFHGIYTQPYLFPQLSPVQSYESLGYEYFVRRPVPMLKEVALFLPLDVFVWLAVLVSFVVCAVVCVIVARVHKVRTKVASGVSFVMLATLVQRCYPVPVQTRRLHSVRLVFGIWFLTVTVISTGYTGVLTSLLANVPLSRELSEFTYSKHPLAQGFRICLLTYPLDNDRDVPRSPDSRYKYAPQCISGSGWINIADDGKDVFMLFGSGFSKVDKLKNQLISRGYVRARTHYSAIVSGPQIKSTSPYRQHLAKIVGRAFEAGLFERAAEMADFRRTLRRTHGTLRHSSEIERDPSSVELLTLHDLRPCFAILVAGLALSCLRLIGEFVTASCNYKFPQ